MPAHAVASLFADHVDAQSLLYGPGQEPARAVRLPVRRSDDLVDGGAVLAAKQDENLVLLGGLAGGCWRLLGGFGALGRTMRGLVGLVGFLAMMAYVYSAAA